MSPGYGVCMVGNALNGEGPVSPKEFRRRMEGAEAVLGRRKERFKDSIFLR